MQQQLAHYQIQDLLGEGTFASVYRAFDQKFEREVALKILKPVWLSDPEAVGRFKREAKTMARLRHAHIVDVYDVGEAGGYIYLAQLLVEGETLTVRLKRGPLAWPEMLDVLRAVAAALDYAHGQDVVHRDIKPSNILLDQNGRAYLGDFGLVRAAEGSMVLSTTSGGMIGTPAYMAPEQWEGKGATAATDVYALSCVVVEMLTGRILFDGATPATVMRQHLLEGPKFPATWPAGVPERATTILQRGLAENPAERIRSAGELARALETSATLPPSVAEAEPIPAPQPSPGPPPPVPKTAPVPRRRSTSGLTVALVGCGAVLALVICLGLAYTLSTSTAPPNKTATARAAIERKATAAQAATAAQLTEQAARDQQTANKTATAQAAATQTAVAAATQAAAARLTEQAARDQQTADETATAQAAATQTAAARLTEQAMRDQPTTPPQQIFPQTEDFVNIPVESGFIAMTWDGNSLWHVNGLGNDGVLYKVSRSGALLGQWTFNGLEFIDGLAFDGSNLWLGNTCCGDTRGLYRVDPDSGNIIGHYLVTPGWGNTNDLTWDGTFIWVASVQPYRLYRLDPTNGETVSSLPGPIPPDYDGPIPDFDGENNTDLVLRGLTWDGEFLWVSESNTSTVMKIDPNTGAIVSYFIADQQPTTLAWDGTYILIGSFSSSAITRYLP